MSKSLEVKGARIIASAIAELVEKYPAAVARALYEEGFAIQAEATKLAPVKYGVLRSSAYTAPPTDPAAPTVEVGFGTKYAARQHEETTWSHPSKADKKRGKVSERPGQAKYLQKAVAVRATGFAERLGKRTMANVQAGLGIEALPVQGPTKPQPDYTLRERGLARERAGRMTKARKALAKKRRK